jgi:intracellular septation protein
MKLVLDFFPILLFFVSYKLSDIYTATAVLMAATAVQMALIYMRERSLQTMHKVTLVLVLGFGALTLGLHLSNGSPPCCTAPWRWAWPSPPGD